MHIVMVIGAGILLLCVFAMFGWLWGASTAGIALAVKAFVPVWLVVACVNMWVGVSHAGYSVREETPILVLNFALPAILAALAAWQLSRG
ncbi:hypothetical protein [Ottowia thiooxydans]|uniref:Apolipoprotein N-acyltransferase n=1 Tax=Ottowia thiooxydans TaxID=219182 RepID=A0ABV2QG35_9BURK